jgi:hypothetical protein
LLLDRSRSKRLAHDSAQRAASKIAIANWIFQPDGGRDPTTGKSSSQRERD